ncbi:MAG TPA: hypothetical protein VHE37_01615 [Nevskiaceae bacterium]|nr:hypothetical protein [Nevskiaceae bacterium]
MVSRTPQQYLQRQTVKGGTAWYVRDNALLTDQRIHLLAWGHEALAVLVLSHGCEIDKKNSARVLVAPVQKIDALEEPVRTKVMSQQDWSLMPLPNVAGLGDCFADLRLITPLQKPVLESCRKYSSMTDAAVARLKAQIHAFFFRSEPV